MFILKHLKYPVPQPGTSANLSNILCWDIRVCLLLSFCNGNLIQHNPLSSKRSVTLGHPEPLCEQIPCGRSELDHCCSPSPEGPREAEPVSHCSSQSLAAFLISAGLFVKAKVSPLYFSEEFTFVGTSSLIPGSLEKGMGINYHTSLPNKHFCDR